MQIAKVIISINTKALDRMFTYSYNKADLNIEIGSVVLVPFGKGNHLKEAYVVDLGVLTEEVAFTIKEIASVVDTVYVEKELIHLAHWMHHRYGCLLTSALSLMLPRDITVRKKTRKIIEIPKENLGKIAQYINESKQNKRLVKRVNLLEFMLLVIEGKPKVPINQGSNSYYFVEKDIMAQFSTTSAVLKDLSEKGLFNRIDEEYDRDIETLNHIHDGNKPVLTPEQFVAVEEITSKKNDKAPIFLLHGVTGSGKTEVYLRSIEEVIESGKQVIVLIPEIGLTPQTIKRFVNRFGPIVGVMHSRLNNGERYEQWLKAKEGKISIMIGARSAIFTPFHQIGMIIIDEEHESTYKSESNPRYHAREIAIKRGLYHHCPVILGSATPLIESYYKAVNHQYKLIELKNRAVANANKDIHIIDLKKELEAGNTSMLSRALFEGMQAALSKGEQVILFINRRGYAGFVSCRKCGFVYKCDDCDVSMTYHKSNQRMICHYCGKSRKVDSICPSCGSKYLKPFGVGTQKVESYVQKIFPDYKIERMDQDTTGGKHSHKEILDRFGNKEIDILIGTQMLAKGHDFHNVTVVGVIAADLSLNQGDFRSSERTFQLLTQVIGRTGRGALKGNAYIQTYVPEHYSIIHAIKEDYVQFFNEEIVLRNLMVYPPYCHILQIICEGAEDSEIKRFLEESIISIHGVYAQFPNEKYIVLGPAKTNISRIKNKHRQRILIKGSSYKMLTLTMKELYNRLEKNQSNLQLLMDINPMHLY